MSAISSSNPAVVAHRGDHHYYGENSLAAMKEAINVAMRHPERPFFIETDVRATRDAVLVLMHDADINRTSNGHGRVEQQPYSALRHVKVPHNSITQPPDYSEAPFFNITRDDEVIPTLSQLCALVAQANHARSEPIGLALEIKPHSNSPVLEQLSDWLMIAASFILGDERVASWLPSTPSVSPLASLLNAQSDMLHDMPLIIFSSAGAIGKRDTQQLWQKLTPATQEALAHIPPHNDTAMIASTHHALSAIHAAPHSLQFADAYVDHSMLSELKTVEQDIGMFWEIGQLDEYTTPVATAALVDDPAMFPALQARGANMLTTNEPDKALQALDENAKSTFHAREESRRNMAAARHNR